jgi:hypothetical protein
MSTIGKRNRCRFVLVEGDDKADIQRIPEPRESPEFDVEAHLARPEMTGFGCSGGYDMKLFV